MGILNLTPDSFYSVSRSGKDDLVDRARKMLDEGASVLDIGAQSTRPGADFLNAEEEWARLEPGLKAVQDALPQAILSIDTFHGEVARRSLDYGAAIINDVSAGSTDPGILDVVAEHRVPYVLMHSPGPPQTMQKQANYEDVLREVFVSLDRKLQELRRRGITDIITDPGFGFGKTPDHNWTLLQHLEYFHGLDAPLLVGVSRKSMFYRMLDTGPEDVLPATTAAHVFALQAGAQILRVHDVAAAAQAVAVCEKLARA